VCYVSCNLIILVVCSNVFVLSMPLFRNKLCQFQQMVHCVKKNYVPHIFDCIRMYGTSVLLIKQMTESNCTYKNLEIMLEGEGSLVCFLFTSPLVWCFLSGIADILNCDIYMCIYIYLNKPILCIGLE